MKRRTTIYVDKKVWAEFMKHVIEKYGRTHGGVISEEVEYAIRLLLKTKK